MYGVFETGYLANAWLATQDGVQYARHRTNSLQSL